VALAIGALSALASPAGAADACRFAIATASVTWPTSEAATAKGVVVRIAYPRSVEVPVAEGSKSPAARVEKRTAASGGLFDSVRRDADGDGHGDLVNVGLVTSDIAPGEFVRVRFDCAPGTPRPQASDFSCSADVAGGAGPIEASCAITLACE
jgi:hypothetical protein